MTREDAILHMTLRREELKHSVSDLDEDIKAFDMAIQALEQEPCEMTAEEYRQRMIQAFHNADCGELIAVCVLPTAKEFEFLEWLLKNHYKKEPCDDAISRQAVLDGLGKYHDGADLHIDGLTYAYDLVCKLPSVSTEKTGRWIPVSERLPEIGQYVLCSLIKAKDVKHRVIICEYKQEVWWSYVQAWMPLPQPYKGESEDNG